MAHQNLLLAGVVLAIIILLNRQRNPYLRVASLVIAMAAGYLLAWALGMLPENTAPTNSALITVPTPLYYGPGIDWGLLLPLMLVFMITSPRPSAISPPPPMSRSSRCPARCT